MNSENEMKNEKMENENNVVRTLDRWIFVRGVESIFSVRVISGKEDLKMTIDFQCNGEYVKLDRIWVHKKNYYVRIDGDEIKIRISNNGYIYNTRIYNYSAKNISYLDILEDMSFVKDFLLRLYRSEKIYHSEILEYSLRIIRQIFSDLQNYVEDLKNQIDLFELGF